MNHYENINICSSTIFYSSMLLCRNSVSKGNCHLQSFDIPAVLNLKSKLPTMQAARENTFNLSYPFGKLQGKFLLNCLLPTFRQSSTIRILPSLRCIGAQLCFPTIYQIPPKRDLPLTPLHSERPKLYTI